MSFQVFFGCEGVLAYFPRGLKKTNWTCRKLDNLEAIAIYAIINSYKLEINDHFFQSRHNFTLIIENYDLNGSSNTYSET